MAREDAVPVAGVLMLRRGGVEHGAVVEGMISPGEFTAGSSDVRSRT